jgi:ABC-2 type transport system ATP-binding protein
MAKTRQGSATATISLSNLSKNYRVHERSQGLGAAVRSLFSRKWKTIPAVQDLSFKVQPGEMVGFLGPNGAGKTTTIKMLAGLIYPSGGEVSVLGENPWKRNKELLQQITLVMGRRNQLVWDIPAIDSFEFFRVIYDIPQGQYRQSLDELVELLELNSLLYKPVRGLSLGERMKCELTVALLHRPKVLFFDEPTIGLDVIAQDRFRKYIAEYNQRYNATVLLTSHYMGDVEALCQRVIFIDHGRLIHDGSLSGLVERFLPYKLIQAKVSSNHTNWTTYGSVVAQENGTVVLQVSKDETPRIVSKILSELQVQEIDIKNPPITDVIKHIYQSKTALETP